MFVFEPLLDAVVDSDTELRLVLALDGRAVAILADESDVLLSLQLTIDSVVDVFDVGLEPTIPTSVDVSLYLGIDGVLSTKITSATELPLTLDIDGFFGAGNESFTELQLNLVIEGYAPLGYENYGFFVEEPAVVFGVSGMSFHQLDETLSMVDTPTSEVTYVLSSVFRIATNMTPLVSSISTIADSIVVRDFITAVFQVELQSAFLAEDVAEADLRLIVALADQLVLADEMTPHLSALITVVSALVLRDAVVIGLDGRIISDISIVDTLEARAIAIVELASTLIVEDEATSGLSLFGLIDDRYVIADIASSSLALLAEILDGFSVGVRFTVGDDTFIGYSVNTKNSAVSSYESYPFNSMTIVAGRPYGASADGIYRLDGDTDDGAQIDARLRMGVTNFGSLLGKRVVNAYIGYVSDGPLVLKVVTMDNGVKKENWYRAKARPQGVTAESRFDIAKGLRGVYWGFELVNVDGADFTLETLQLYPVILNRRYSGR